MTIWPSAPRPWIVVGLSLFLAATTLGQSPPVSVSPGVADASPTAADRCAAFTWALVDGASGYEFEIWSDPPDDDMPDEPALRHAVEGQVGAWQPDPARCLSTGSYRWRVRALTAPDAPLVAGPWSQELRFEIASADTGPGPPAATMLERYLRWEKIGDMDAAAPPSMGNPATRGEPATGARGLGSVAEEALLKALAAASLTDEGSALRAVRSEKSGAAVGVVGTTDSSASAGVIAVNTSGGPDLVLGRESPKIADRGHLKSEAPGGLHVESAGDIRLSTVGWSVRAGGTDILAVDVNGKLSAASFRGDGSGITGVVVDDVYCGDIGDVPVVGYGCVSPDEIADESLTGADVGMLEGTDIALDTLKPWHFVDGTVFQSHFAIDSIGGASLALDSVGSDEIASGGVGRSEIATDAVGLGHIANGSIHESELATVRRVKVSCNGRCDGAWPEESSVETCRTVTGGLPLMTACSQFVGDITYYTKVSCGGDNLCILGNEWNMSCADVDGSKDAIVLCLDP